MFQEMTKQINGNMLLPGGHGPRGCPKTPDRCHAELATISSP